MKENENNIEIHNRQEDLRFEGLKVVNSKDGWITLDGLFYSCESDEHDACAKHLFETNKEQILEYLNKTGEDQLALSADNTPTRFLLLHTGYALLSNNLLAETNLPKMLTRQQYELIEKYDLKFTQGTDMVDPGALLEFSDIIQGNKKLRKYSDSFKFYSWDNHDMKSFMENPSNFLHIWDEKKY